MLIIILLQKDTHRSSLRYILVSVERHSKARFDRAIESKAHFHFNTVFPPDIMLQLLELCVCMYTLLKLNYRERFKSSTNSNKESTCSLYFEDVQLTLRG